MAGRGTLMQRALLSLALWAGFWALGQRAAWEAAGRRPPRAPPAS